MMISVDNLIHLVNFFNLFFEIILILQFGDFNIISQKNKKGKIFRKVWQYFSDMKTAVERLSCGMPSAKILRFVMWRTAVA